MPSYIFDRATMQMVDKNTYYANRAMDIMAKRSDLAMPFIQGDLKPYESPVTGKVIEGRAARREDLARAGCREVDPSEYKPVYKNYEFCQKNRLPYMGDVVPPPMTRDEKVWAKEKRKAAKAAEKKATSGPEQPQFLRGNTKTAPLFKNNTVKD